MNMINPNFRRTTALVFILAAGAALTAQESGTLSGTVRDSVGRPVQGALVSITSPNMLGVRNATTNERGEYRVPLLPVGNYRIVVSRQGYVGQRAVEVRVGLGASVSQNFTMRAAAEASETVEITTGGDSGMVDKTETGAKTNVSAEELSMLPVNRTFTGAVQLTPGVVTGASGQFNVRGGQAQQTQYRLNGADIKDDYQGVLTGVGTIQDNVEDVQVVLSETHARFGRSLGGSVNVITKSGSNTFSGSMRAAFDRNSWRGTNQDITYRGNVVNDDLSRNFQYTINGPIIKDRLWFAISGILYPTASATYGINGTLLANYQNGMLWAPETEEEYIANPATGQTARRGVLPDLDHPMNRILLGGPSAAGIPGNWSVRNPVTNRLMDAGGTYNLTNAQDYNEYKITAMPIQNHTIEIGYILEDQTIKGRNAYGDGSAVTTIYRLAQTGDQISRRQTYNYAYRGIIGDKLFIEARYNKRDSIIDWPDIGMDVAYLSEITMYLGNRPTDRLNTGIQNLQPFGRGIGLFLSDRSNRSGNLNVKYIADFLNANHEIDVGVDYFRAKIWEASADVPGFRLQVGGAVYTNYDLPLVGREPFLISTMNFVAPGLNGSSPSGTTGPAAVYFENRGYEGLNFTDSWSYYINDKFVINNHWNGMVGLRYESNSMTNSRGVEYAKSSFLSPRLQLTYDMNGDNAHLFTATAAMYGTDFNARLADTLSEKANDISIRWGWSANPYEPNDELDPTGLRGIRFVTYEELINPANYRRVVNFADSSRSRLVQDLETPYMTEFTIGYKRQLRNGTSVGINYVNRAWRNDWAAKSEYLPEYFAEIPDPTNTGLTTQYQQQTRWFSAGNDLMRDYQGLEMDFTARLNAYWTVGGNWTISRLTGNDEGGDNTGSFADYQSKAYYNNRSLYETRGITTDMVSPYGRLINDQTNRGRLFATLQLPLGQGNISFAPMLYYNGGLPTSLTITNSVTPGIPTLPRPDGGGNLPAAGGSYTEYWNGRGWRQTNDHFYVDFGISFAIPLGMKGPFRRLQMMGNIDVYNLFNARIYNDGFYGAGLVTNTATDTTNDYYSDTNGYFRWDNDNSPVGSWLFGTVNRANDNYWRSARSVTASIGLRF